MKLYNPGEKIHANPRLVWHEAMLEIGKLDRNIVALGGDLSRSTCTESFRAEFPDRFFNMGIAEQDMVGVAAGLALEGKIPYCVSFAPFLSMRALEQVRTDICYMNLNARIVAPYSGVSAAGATHSGLEDAGIFRGLPNMTIMAPSDVGMVKKIFHASVKHKGPIYIRLSQATNDPEIYAEDYEYKIGKAIITRMGGDATIISFGGVLQYAVEAAARLSDRGIQVGVIDMHTLKPLDNDAVLKAVTSTKHIVTVEDHQIINGLGSAVSELIAESGNPCAFKRLGLRDTFTGYGNIDQLHKKYGYGAEAIVEAVDLLLEKNKAEK
jgi:transketolase